MMIRIITLITLLFSINVSANYLQVSACSSKQLISLEESIQDWKKNHGYSDIYYIKNLKNQILGYYSSYPDYELDGIHAEICEYVDSDELTVSSEWYYWEEDEESTSPSKWRRNKNIRISQDEGFAYFKVIAANKKGNIRAQFSVVGWSDDTDKETTVRSSEVIFDKRD